MQDTDDLEPLGYYRQTLKAALEKNAADYFDALIEKAGVRREENRQKVSDYNAAVIKASAAEKTYHAGRALRRAVILAAVALFIVGAGFALSCIRATVGWKILTAAFCFVCAVVLSVLYGTVFRRLLQARQKDSGEAAAAAKALYDEAMAQLAPLHALYTGGMTRDIIEKTYSEIRIDDSFDVKKFDLMQRKYGFRENADRDCSTLCLLSGTLGRNPFVYVRTLRCSLYTAVYTGSLVISWTTTTRDSQGRTHTVQHSQTLTATYSAPAPRYEEETRLYYGNEAAPDLSFSRRPTHAETFTDKEVARAVRKGQKTLQKKAAASLSSGGNFTEMGNAEFDVLFGAIDRDNEVQFRLLFTPLAQKNILALLRSDEAYGDDFTFVKEKCLNCIRSEHAQGMPFETDPSRFVGHDLAASRAAFIAWQCEYFRSMYFDLAPLLAIPAYKMQKPREFIYKDVYESNCSSYETETAANRFSASVFAHPDTGTRTVLKTQFIRKDGLADRVNVRAYSYNAVPRVALISVYGGDGYMHDVPVPWTEYIPLTRDSVMEVKRVGGTREAYREKFDVVSEHLKRYGDHVAFGGGILAVPVLRGEYDAAADAAFSRAYGLTVPEQTAFSAAPGKVPEAAAAEKAEAESAHSEEDVKSEGS